jgi:hypothetical protein
MQMLEAYAPNLAMHVVSDDGTRAKPRRRDAAKVKVVGLFVGERLAHTPYS